MSDLGELGRLEIALYRRALTNPSNSLADLARDLECTTEELDKPAKRLAEIGALSHRTARPRGSAQPDAR